MMHDKRLGRLAALVTIAIWGTTFIATKLLLEDFTPVEILFLRFALGLLALLAADPHPLRGTTRRQELTFAAAGLCGVCLYYLLENVALTHTLASNVGVILSTSPFFTAILTRFVEKGAPLRARFAAGFAVSMAGICLISFGGARLELHPTGDLLALAAALLWACYSVLSRRISEFGYPTVRTTRRVFAYGLLCMLPALAGFGFRPDPARLVQPGNLFGILFLGLGASALCFVTWGFAVRALGAVTTSVYIYMVPVITVVTSVLVLRERITGPAAFGVLLTLAGLLLSEDRFYPKKRGIPDGTE